MDINVNFLNLISFLSLYIKVEEEEKELLSRIVVHGSFKKKEIIHQEGKVQKHLAFIIKGAVRFFYTNEEGEENTFNFAFENLPIGNYNTLLNSSPAPASAEALEYTELIAISKDNLLAFMNQFPRYYPVITNIMGKAMTDIEMRDKLLRIQSSRLRYQELSNDRPEIIKRVPLTHIASYLKMALGTLSRIRAGKL